MAWRNGEKYMRLVSFIMLPFGVHNKESTFKRGKSRVQFRKASSSPLESQSVRSLVIGLPPLPFQIGAVDAFALSLSLSLPSEEPPGNLPSFLPPIDLPPIIRLSLRREGEQEEEGNCPL